VFCWGGFLDFALILFRKDGRAGHDLAAGTRVVRVGAPKVGIIVGTGAFCFVLLGLIARDVVFPLPVRAYFTPSGSMENTLQIGDPMLVSTIAYRLNDPQDGEIAIFKAPRAGLLNRETNLDVDFVKRVVGTPGQVVEMRKAKLFVNGKPVAEPFAFWDADYAYDMNILGARIYSRDYEGKQAGPWTVNGIIVKQADQDLIQKAMPGKVPTNSYLMLGDHRSNSNDSHVWGFAPRTSFRGRAIRIFWPIPHWRSLQ
jgi:signal peptidase I